ncbi:MAG: HAD family phosphatase [Clostridia bacterium]|nr:HAD family phosphatase [Clostridia bacterium]
MVTKHYLFDFDGTLVDSMGHWARAMLQILDDHGIPYEDNIIEVITPLGLHGTARHFISMGMEGTVEEVLEEMNGHLTPLYCNVIPLKESVKECLLAMKAKGIGLHVLTASPHRWLDPCLKREGAFDIFDNVWSCEDFGTGKTNPDIYVQAAARIGAAVEEVTFLDDNINADKAALLSGMRVYGVFDPTSASAEAEMHATCHGYVRDFAELLVEIAEA